MAALTYLSGHVMALVPPGTVAESSRTVAGHDGPRDVLVLPPEKQLPLDRATGTPLQPRLRMAASNNPGVIFAVTLCLVIVITNVHMRGLWSVVVILAIAFVAVLLAVLGWWDVILNAFGLLDIHISALGYVSISLFLFAIWALTFLLYDRRMATIFSRGQVRVRTVIGGGETTYDTERGPVRDPERHIHQSQARADPTDAAGARSGRALGLSASTRDRERFSSRLHRPPPSAVSSEILPR
jgi:hypothetical protein